MKTVSFINLKGGVGKTTISVHFAYAVSKMFPDIRILFIDNDKQGNASRWLKSPDDSPDNNGTLAHLIMGDTNNAKDVIHPSKYENIDIIPADMGLLDANVALTKNEEVNQTTILKTAIAPVLEDYDLCVVDNPPDINISVFNTLSITDDVVIVSTPDEDSLDGLKLMLQQIKDVQQFNPNINLKGALLNFYTPLYPDIFNIIGGLRDNNIPIFDTKIHYASKPARAHLAYCRRNHITIFEKNPQCRVAHDFKGFVKEFFS